jgi:hypothetical protein
VRTIGGLQRLATTAASAHLFAHNQDPRATFDVTFGKPVKKWSELA